MSAKKHKKPQKTYSHKLYETPPGEGMFGCLASLPVVPIAVSLVLCRRWRRAA